MKTKAIEIRSGGQYPSFELIRSPEELAHWFGRHAGTKYSWQGQRATKAQREVFLKLWATMTSFEFKPVPDR